MINPATAHANLHNPVAINHLVHAIYKGVLEDQPWHSFLNQLNQLLDADIVVLLVMSNQQADNKYLLNRVVNTQATLPESAHHWIALDPFQNIPVDTPVLLDDLDHQSAIEQSSFFQDLIKPSGMRYILAIDIPASGSTDLILKLRLARSHDKHNFSNEERGLFVSLIDHLKLALQFLDQKAIRQIERNAFADAINQFMLGTLILDRAGKIVGSNRVARDTIEHYPALSIREGSLVIADKETNQQLYSVLDDIGRGHGSTLPRTITIHSKNAATLGLMIRPVRPEDAMTHPVHAHAVVFISDSQKSRHISSETLKELFGLTGSEARIAAYLANGDTLTEAAQALSISINTAKSHARNIYEKTGVKKQIKFIQLVSNSVARVS